MRLLLVEDDPNLSRSLAAQLEQAGYSVERSMDGREGLYYAREYPVDLAIVDLGLPTMSGVELIKQLRADGKAYPILVLTARDRWQDKVEALKLGADDYVVKPFNVEELLARVDALLRRAGYVEGVDWMTRKYEGDEHSERAWRRRVDVPLQFLLGR